MNEQQHSPGSMELPKPQAQDNMTNAPENLYGAPESDAASSARVEQGINKSAVASPAPMIDNQGQGVAQTTPQTDDGLSTTSDTQHLIADESDLIEKEWVVKAKQIVEQTKTDPHLQSKEMVKIKADYLKKRYNKEIRTTED